MAYEVHCNPEMFMGASHGILDRAHLKGQMKCSEDTVLFIPSAEHSYTFGLHTS
jgi:hypothetical protein